MRLLKQIKSIFALSKPSKLYTAMQIIFNILHISCKIVEPIFTANVITSLTIGDFNRAYIFLICDIGQVILRNIFAHIHYLFYIKNYNFQYRQMQSRFLNKIINASYSNFNKTPKEALMTMVVSNFGTVGNFCDAIIGKIGKVVQVVMSIFIVMTTNIWVGLAILLMSFVDSFILIKLNKSLAKAQDNIFKAKDEINNELSYIIDNKEKIHECDEQDSVKRKYMKSCDKYLKYEARDSILNSYKSNIFFVIYKFMIFLITCLLISLVSQGLMTLTLYLIVTPYLLTCTEQLNEIINTTYNIENTMVSVNRINTVLNFTEDELIKFGNIKENNGDYNISFLNVKYANTDNSNQYYGSINDIDISFKYNAMNIIKGNKNSGKRIIYYLLSRKIKPDSGVILIDNINIFDYEKDNYKKHVFYNNTYPIFKGGSILKNLKEVNKDFDKIKSVCSDLGIYDYIMNLPNNFSTNINNSGIPQDILYLIGIARMILNDSHIMLVYDFPSVMTQEEKTRVMRALGELKKGHTILLFTSSSDYDNIADLLVTLENNKIKSISFK